MSAFYRKNAEKISVPYKRLSIVRNPDGFLSEPSVQRALTAETGILFVTGSPFELRLHFELSFKEAPDTRFCYICENPSLLLPDIRREAWSGTFSVADLFPNVMDRQTLLKQPASVLEALFDRNLAGFISASDLARELLEIQYASRVVSQPEIDLVALMAQFVPDWSKLTETVTAASSAVLAAIRQDKYAEIGQGLTSLNASFQEYLASSYFGSLHSSHVLGPKSVNKILPYLSFKHSLSDKVALLVVDGMAYWQYLVLQEQLQLLGITPASSTIFAWMPTITMLSRQAIFRGDDPVLSYKQNPASEEKLWSAWWTEKGVPSSDIQYIYGESEVKVWSTTRRLALVTVVLDEVMHISERTDMLLACTQAWAWNFAKQILALHDAGFFVYITTDHGNVLAEGAGTLSSAEKTHLFADGSRGARHLIYDAVSPMKEYLSSHDASGFLVHDNWLAYRDTSAFLRPGKHQITHGGSHLLEVAIPFIEISL